MGFPEFLKKKTIDPIHFIPGIYPYGVSLFTPRHFRVPSLICGPLVAKYLAEKMGFPELFEKNIGSIHFIPGIYLYGVSLLTPIYFRVPCLIFGPPLVAKYLAENGVSGTFWKKLLAQFFSYLAFILMGWVSWPLYIFVFLASFSWRIPTCVAHVCKIEIVVGYFWMRWIVIRAEVYCPHLWAQLVSVWMPYILCEMLTNQESLNDILGSKQNSRYFADDISKSIFSYEIVLLW